MQLRKRTQRRHSLLDNYASDLGSAFSRRRSERALRAAGIEAALASRAKSEFLANMSHELRTPLNAIIGFAELMRDFPAEESAQRQNVQYAANIARAGRQLLMIVDDVLAMSAADLGRIRLNRERHDIRDIIAAALSFAKARFEEKKIELVTRFDPGLPPLLLDAQRVRLVVGNLLSNAAKFTGERGRITVMASHAEGKFIRVSISDTGPGMTVDQIEHALKPFAQVRSDTSRAHEGLGLGLPITRAIVHAHGGELQLSSGPGQGTTVLFSLPLGTPTGDGK